MYQVEILSPQGEVRRTVTRSQAQVDEMIACEIPLVRIIGSPKQPSERKKAPVQTVSEEAMFTVGVSEIEDVANAIRVIETSYDVKFLQECKGDERKSVWQAAEKRMKELSKNK